MSEYHDTNEDERDYAEERKELLARIRHQCSDNAAIMEMAKGKPTWMLERASRAASAPTCDPPVAIINWLYIDELTFKQRQALVDKTLGPKVPNDK